MLDGFMLVYTPLVRVILMENTILSYNGIEIYQTEIDILCNEYIDKLHDKSMIYKSNVFSGMLKYIYDHKLKYILPDSRNHDYKLLDSIFYNVYIVLCSQYNIVPSVLQFSTMLCNTGKKYFSEVKSGVYSNGGKVNPDHKETVEKWFNTCESMLLGKVANENGIGSMFILKANYGYTETQNIVTTPMLDTSQNTPIQIQQKYQNAIKPELIEVE